MRKKTLVAVVIALPCLLVAISVIAQGPFGRRHTVTEVGTLKPIPATENPPESNQVKTTIEGDQRVIESNGIPNHKTGVFPNRGNPNRIRPQRYVYRVPAKPAQADRITPIRGVFGIAVNGVPFDPGAAEFYNGNMGSIWQYEPLSGAINLGIDVSHAHVQPNGAYHYHGLPTELLSAVKIAKGKHSPLIGWAADGFPMYAVYGYSEAADATSEVVALTSSFRLREGKRPGGNEPGGTYDGTFVADYEFDTSSGDLDECNGRFTVTPDFPQGTYAYILTENWPVIPRNFQGTPSDDFLRRGPGNFFGPGPGPGRSGPGPGGPPGRVPGTRPGRRPPSL